MYIESIELENVRTFAAKKRIEFLHPDTNFREMPDLPTPNFKNINLLFGGNATGKTTVLEAIALAALGPTIEDAQIAPRPIVRFAPRTGGSSKREKSEKANIKANVLFHEKELLKLRDDEVSRHGFAELAFEPKGELERRSSSTSSNANWEKSYESNNDLFFVVAYGATRRTEQNMDSPAYRDKSKFGRANRIESVVIEGCPLIPLKSWFAAKRPKRRRDEIVDLINRLLGKKHFTFTGDQRTKNGDFVFIKGGLDIPFASLSDGYRGFLSWISDLLYHLDSACGDSSKSLRDISGIVLVDEIDLHLHPEWQMEVIKRLSKALPRIQFILTSHSPLIAGSVEWMNIVHLRLDRQHRTGVDQFREAIHGLDADQILVSSLFGLKSTRANTKRNRLKQLTIEARKGDDSAATRLITELARGLEARE